jgi:hypothetical protein
MLLPQVTSAPTDFDFFIGHWNVSHQRLKTRLNRPVSATDWEHFQGVCITQKTLGGFGNIDDNILELPSGSYRAMTVRSYDVVQGTWSIWWLDARSPHNLDTPVIGRFVNGALPTTGIFLADDTWQDQPIKVRFLWTIPANDCPRWEQAFSPDGGNTWETNWIMNFTRHQ